MTDLELKVGDRVVAVSANTMMEYKAGKFGTVTMVKNRGYRYRVRFDNEVKDVPMLPKELRRV